MSKNTFSLLVLAGALAAAASPASAVSISNGDFEAVQISFNSNNPADFPGWTHTGSQGDALLWSTGYFDGGGVAHAGQGRQFVTMGGGFNQAPGTSVWSNTITGLNTGQTYTLSFIIAHEADFSGAQTVNVSLGGGPSVGFTTTSNDPIHYWDAWEKESLQFIATGASEGVSFSATTSFDVGLDNLQVAASGVPELANWA